MGLHLPARKPLHGRPGPELQQLTGASGAGGQSESSTPVCFPVNLPYKSGIVNIVFSYFQRVAELADSEGWVQAFLLHFASNVSFLCVFSRFFQNTKHAKQLVSNYQ